jgi:hypothetical protein
MARINPGMMMLDGGEVAAPRAATASGLKADSAPTPKIPIVDEQTKAEAKSIIQPVAPVRTAPTDLNSPEALEYNQYLKGKATAGGLAPEELEWTKIYNKHRYEVLKGKATAGVKLTPEEKAESDFLVGLGVGGKIVTAKPEIESFVSANGETKKLDPNFVSLPISELITRPVIIANAKANGMTPEEYVKSRGGVNASGYYGDSYGIYSTDGVSLTDAEYAAAIAANVGGPIGATGAGVNAALAKKILETTGKSPDWLPSVIDSAKANGVDVATVFAPVGPTLNAPAGPTLTAPAGPTLTAPVGPTGVTGTLPTNTTGTLPTGVPAALTYKASDGTVFTDQSAYVGYQRMLSDKTASDAALSAENATKRQSAYDLLNAEFSKYGLGSLVQPLEGLIKSGASPDEFSLKLRESEPYKQRFKANAQRISKGLKAISEAEYIGLEDQYQNILRNAGLPDSYWKQTVDARTGIVSQEGFSNFIANDVSALELKDRVSTAQERLIYANPEVSIALKTFYPDISNGDLLAYALDPTKGLEQIKRRITAAEVGSSAVQMGLTTNVTDAEYLARYGVTKAAAQQGYRTAAEVLPTASKLGDIYASQGLGAYTQQTAEQEIFNVPGAAEAAAKRKKLVGLEQAAFSGQSGLSQGALARDRAGNF